MRDFSGSSFSFSLSLAEEVPSRNRGLVHPQSPPTRTRHTASPIIAILFIQRMFQFQSCVLWIKCRLRWKHQAEIRGHWPQQQHGIKRSSKPNLETIHRNLRKILDVDVVVTPPREEKENTSARIHCCIVQEVHNVVLTNSNEASHPDESATNL